MNAQDVIKKLNLSPLPEEGGYYKETYRDPGFMSTEGLEHPGDKRSFSTCIYYLITPEEFSGLHAVRSTETFHFYGGDPVKMIQIDASGQLSEHIMGSNLLEDQKPQIIVEPHIWQGTKLLEGGSWALLGCTVAPGFEFEDFFGGTCKELSAKFPQHEKVIQSYTHS